MVKIMEIFTFMESAGGIYKRRASLKRLSYDY